CSHSRPATRKVMFSADGGAVVTVAGVSRCDQKETVSDAEMVSENALRIQLWDTVTRSPLPSKPLCLTENSSKNTTQPASANTNVVVRPQDAPPTIDIKAAAKMGTRYWIVGIKDKQIYAWDAAGSESHSLLSGQSS